MRVLLNVIKTLLPIVLAVLLVYLAFRNIDFSEFWANASQVDYRWVMFSIGLSIIAYVSRAYRWNLLLAPLGYRPKLLHTSLAVLVGYLANLALPRLGEVVRCSLLTRMDKVPVSVGFGTVISERLVDMLTLLGLVAMALILEFDLLTGFLGEYLNGSYEWVYWTVIIGATVGIVGLLALIYLFKRGFFPKVRSFLLELLDGLLSIRRMKNIGGFVASTLVLWLVYYLMSYTIIFSLPATSHLDLSAGLLLLVTGGIAIALPVQAGFGTYHTMIAGLLLVYGIPEVTGLFLATLLHTSQIIAIALFGGIGLLLSLFIRPAT